MTSERGFFAGLLNRRVPQILGLYIGGVWLCIEIGQWLAEEFAVPARLPAYLFVLGGGGYRRPRAMRNGQLTVMPRIGSTEVACPVMPRI